MKLYAASDHVGFALKQLLVEEARGWGYQVVDLGPESEARVDYPDYAWRVVERVSQESGSRGLLCCGSGIGVAMVANKAPGVRAATLWSEESACLSRQHNDANVFAIGARVVQAEQACLMLKAWLETPFEGGRHAVRVEKIEALERLSCADCRLTWPALGGS